GLKGAVLFYDAQVEYAERLAVENALAARESGARVLTYARVERLIKEGGAVRGVEFTDTLGGGSHKARSRVVLNAAGPWVDEVLGGEAGRGEPLVGGTKGSHVVVGAFEGAPGVALYSEAIEDGRPFFVIPWDGKFLVGTTDERYSGDLDRVDASPREVEYLLREANRLLPSANLTPGRVLYTYSGVRPLAFAGSRAEAAVTRRHFVRPSRLLGLFSLVGGKLTTYRSLAEQAVSLVFKELGRRPRPCETMTTPLPGAVSFDEFGRHFRERSTLAPRSTERLLKIYGSRAGLVLELAGRHHELREVISEETGSVAAEVVFSFESEMAETLSDCLFRRTMVGLNSAAGTDAAERAAAVAQKFLGWGEERAAREVENYAGEVERLRPRVPE
ncbi:MAG TPA: glycerol-3-phosphate dehydrogenase/oxidase, partial [Pyrinomonadaceae bacterium]|nr:glycerol-3-phosphate dehydrogenase/oxidase [Pyrinomonadaceae bacterium]